MFTSFCVKNAAHCLDFAQFESEKLQSTVLLVWGWNEGDSGR